MKTAILEGSPTYQGYQYDAFGRMTGYFTNINTLSDQLAAYRYNGLGQRIMWQYDVDSASGLEADEQYFFVHDAKGRVVASMRHTGTGDVVTIQEAFVYHAAGVAGRGASSLSESAILRDVDSDYKWATASDDVLNVRTFYVQNWKGDVVAVLDSDGKPLERVRYTAFGTPSAHPIADVDGNGKVEAADVTKFLAFAAGGANATVFTETDLNADGLFPDDADIEFFDDEYSRASAVSAGGPNYGINRLSSVASRKGHGGYEWRISTTTWGRGAVDFDSESKVVTQSVVYERSIYGRFIAGVAEESSANHIQLPGIGCRNDYDGGDCEKMCADNPGAAGITHINDLTGWPEFCCICHGNIRRIIPFAPAVGPPLPDDVGYEEGIRLFTYCTLRHELEHMRQLHGTPNCKESLAWQDTVACLSEQINVCRTAECERLLTAELAYAIRAAALYRKLCDKEIDTPPGSMEPGDVCPIELPSPVPNVRVRCKK